MTSKASRSLRMMCAITVVGGSLAAGQAQAHHSSAMFDRTKTYVLKGKLIEYQFMAPHSWISIMAVKDGKGMPARWDLEGSSAGRMRAQGITPERLKKGDMITART